MSTTFERRRFLVLAASGVSVIAFACSRDENGASPKTSELESAWLRARESQRPLLVLIELDSSVRTEPSLRGRFWGDYLDGADPRALADVALCELVFARRSEVAASWPAVDLSREHDTPFGLVVRPDRGSFEPLPAGFVATALKAGVDEEGCKLWIPEVAERLHTLIAPDDATFDLLAARTLGDVSLAREYARRELAHRQQLSLAKVAPAGARWAQQDLACGSSIRLENGSTIESGALCGMGYVEGLSRRFLHLYRARDGGARRP